VDTVTAIQGGYVATGGSKRLVPQPGWMGTIGGAVEAWWSPDAVTWSRASVEVPKGGAQWMGQIYETDKGLLATGFLYVAGDDRVAFRSAVWTSSDHGHSWQYHATDTTEPEELRASFVPEIPVSQWGMLASDGHRFVSFSTPVFGWTFGEMPFTGVWESFDGTTWHQLNGAGLEFLGSLILNGELTSLKVDDSGVLVSWDAGADGFVVRGWAVP
jgi:hypothetical protein